MSRRSQRLQNKLAMPRRSRRLREKLTQRGAVTQDTDSKLTPTGFDRDVKKLQDKLKKSSTHNQRSRVKRDLLRTFILGYTPGPPIVPRRMSEEEYRQRFLPLSPLDVWVLDRLAAVLGHAADDSAECILHIECVKVCLFTPYLHSFPIEFFP